MNYQTKIVLFLSLLAQFSKEYPADSALVANFVSLETSQNPIVLGVFVASRRRVAW